LQPLTKPSGMMFFIGILIPYNDDRLLHAGSTTGTSPLTLSLLDAHVAPAAHLINALIVISVISAGNSSLYVASRTMLYLARSQKAPSFLGHVDKRGVPWAGLLISNLFACISFMSVGAGAGTAYNALITLSGVATFIVWGTIGLVHIRFRQALVAQGECIDSLPFKAMWYPYGTYASLAANVFLVFFQVLIFLATFEGQD
jgi:amino acid transporter